MSTESSAGLSRRQWLRNTGLGLGATVALPGLLPASEMSRVLGGGLPYSALLEQMERDVTTARRAAGPIRLCYNENPFGMSPKAKDALKALEEEYLAEARKRNLPGEEIIAYARAMAHQYRAAKPVNVP